MQNLKLLSINSFFSLEKIYLYVRERKELGFFLFIKILFWVFSQGYRLGLIVHKLFQNYFMKQVIVPSCVVSIGNIAVGGSGKTPFILKIAQDLEKNNPSIVAKGYRSKGSKESCKEVLAYHTAEDVGDEPLWLARNLPFCPLFVGKSKSFVAKILDPLKHPLLLIDDGLQHRKLKKDFSIILLHAQMDWEKGYLPKGHLRDSPRELQKANLVVIHQVGSFGEFTREMIKARKYTSSDIIGTKLVLDAASLEKVKNKKVAIVTAIAFPLPFIQEMKMHCEVKEVLTLPDHAPIREEELLKWWTSLESASEIEYLICTEKDEVKWPSNHPIPCELIALKGELKIMVNFSLYEKAIQEIRKISKRKQEAAI